MKAEKIAEAVEIGALLSEARYHRNVSCKDKKAIKICGRILKIDPNNRDAMLIKAGALKSLNRNNEAVALMNSIVKKWPNHWEAYYLLSGHYFSIEEDDKALELIDKSLELEERFDNVIQKAQMLYLIGKGDYMEFVEKAKKIDKERTENFMKNVWIYDMDNVKPTFKEWRDTIKSIRRLKKDKKFFLSEERSQNKRNKEKAGMTPVVEWVCQNGELMDYFNNLLKKYPLDNLGKADFDHSMLLDGFIFDYKIPKYGKTPFELFLEKAEISESEKKDYEILLNNIFSAFKIVEVEKNKGIKLYDIMNNKPYYVKEKKGAHGAEVGNMIECRIAEVSGSFRIIGPGGFNWPAEAAYAIKRAVNTGQLGNKKVTLFDMLDIVLKIKDSPPTTDELVDELKKKFENLGINFNFSDLDKRINTNTELEKAFPEVFKHNFLSMGDFEEVMGMLSSLWNSYPRDEFNGKSPAEEGGAIGPKEEMLISMLLSEGTAKITPDKYPSQKEAIKAMEKFKEGWLDTPQKELKGRTPREEILIERKRLRNKRKDISLQIQLSKIDDFDGNKAEKLYFDALAAHKKDNYGESIKLLKGVIEMYPENYKAWGNMGASYAGLGEKGEALKCLRKSLSINPKYKIAKKNLKIFESLVDYYDEKFGLNQGTDEKDMLELAVESEFKEDYRKALGYTKKILDLYPKSYHALFLKYRINEKIGKVDKINLKLAFKEAKKQNSSAGILKLIEDEIHKNGLRIK